MSVRTVDHRAEADICQLRKKPDELSLALSTRGALWGHPQECCHHGHRQIQPPSSLNCSLKMQSSCEEHPVSCAGRRTCDQPGRMPASHQHCTQKGRPRNGNDSKGPNKCALWSERHARFTWKPGPHRTRAPPHTQVAPYLSLTPG